MAGRLLCAVLACLAIVGRVGIFISTPLWLDHFNTTSPPGTTVEPPKHTVSVYFLLITQWSVATIVFGSALLVLRIMQPNIVTSHTPIPKRFMLIIGVSQAVSSVLFNYAVSGTRTAPYLQAVLSNCNIPIQFITRFVLLRLRPTCIKLACAIAVAIAEFICLIPNIFPGLEGKSAHQQEGGSTGAGRFLWPLCFVMSMVPFAVANTTMERSIKKDQNPRGSYNGPAALPLLNFLFLWTLIITVTVACLFWTDIIPYFGTSKNFSEFLDNFAFDLKCLFGQAGCSPATALLGWSNYIFNIVGCIALAGLMRYSEGANFAIIVLTLRTPIIFLFWTLFTEAPFAWAPHAHLSTWLSMGGIAIMLPAVIIYDLSGKDVKMETTSQPEEQERLVCSSTSDSGTVYHSISTSQSCPSPHPASSGQQWDTRGTIQ